MIRQHIGKVIKRSVTVSDYGTEVLTWMDLDKVSGFLDIISISKGKVAGKIIEDSTHVFVTKEIANIQQGDRLRFNELTYEVNHVDNPMMTNHHLEIELKLIPEQDSQSEMSIYFGVLANETVVEADVLALQNQVMKTKAFSNTISVVDGNLFIVYPKSFGKSSIRLKDKLITNWNIQEITINGVTHYCYKVAVTSGSMKIELF